MTNNKGFVYFDDAVVSREGTLYKIELESEEIVIFQTEELVDAIANKTKVDPSLIAIILAYIEFVRISRRAGDNLPRRLDNRVIASGISILLMAITIEELIGKIKSMKWHEVVYVLTAESPIEEIKEL